MSWLICEDVVRHCILKFVYKCSVFDKLLCVKNKRFHGIIIQILQQLVVGEIKSVPVHGYSYLNYSNRHQKVLQHLNFSSRLNSPMKTYYFITYTTFYKTRFKIKYNLNSEFITFVFYDSDDSYCSKHIIIIADDDINCTMLKMRKTLCNNFVVLASLEYGNIQHDPKFNKSVRTIILPREICRICEPAIHNILRLRSVFTPMMMKDIRDFKRYFHDTTYNDKKMFKKLHHNARYRRFKMRGL